MTEKIAGGTPPQERKKGDVELLEREVEAIDREYEKKGITPELRTAFAFMLGKRPAGGPYEITITDDARFKTRKEYKLGIKLVEYPEDEEERTVVEQGVFPDLIGVFQDLEKRRYEALNKSRGLIKE